MTYGEEARLRHEAYTGAHRKEAEQRTTDKGLLLGANDYYQAYVALRERDTSGNGLLMPMFYLLCHALELALKSWLRRKGYSLKQLRKFDHNLIALMSELIDKHDVVIAPEIILAVEQANYYYDNKQYEYYSRGAMTLPSPDDLSKYVRLFLGMVKSSIVGMDSVLPKE